MVKIRLFNSQMPSEVKEINLLPETMVGGECLIGRNPSCALVLDGAEVSRMHGKISFQDARYYYTDLASSGGSWINAEQVKVKQPYLLKGGDIIRIGGYVLMILGLGSEDDSTVVGREQDNNTVLPGNDPVTQQQTLIGTSTSSNHYVPVAMDTAPSPVELPQELEQSAEPTTAAAIDRGRAIEPAPVAPQPVSGAGLVAPQQSAVDVDCTVFSPAAVSVGETFFVQVFAHRAELDEVVKQLAREFDPETERRGFRSLSAQIEPGSRLTFELVMPEMEIDSAIEKLTWRDRPEPVQFGVSVPQGEHPRNLIGTVTITQNSVSIGHVKFKLARQ